MNQAFSCCSRAVMVKKYKKSVMDNYFVVNPNVIALVMISLPLPSLDLTVTSLMSLLSILGLVHF